ncbi:MAG: TIGR03564 family F420-dependent LLM class oxidoreductase [Acidimicrobiia bacterium]
MRIGIFFPTVEQGTVDEMVGRFAELEAAGFTSGWLPQSAGHDAVTLLSVVGHEVPRLELGTAVVPTYPRHPLMLAAQALTANQATGGRLRLGIGLSHKLSIEPRYGLSYDKPARHMREYLSILLPAVKGETADFAGEVLTGRGQVTIKAAAPPPVLLAALQPAMLRMAGSMADGTITWCTGKRTVEEQIVPHITGAASEAGRPSPRVVVALPVIVTEDEADGRAKADKQLDGYGRIPVYRAVLDREGAETPGDVSIVGDEASVTAQLRHLESVGMTEFIGIPCGTEADRARTREHLAGLVG